jgi:hypothetical protein
MQGPKAPKTGATSPLPRPHRPDKWLPYEMSKPGQGPGESEVPTGTRRMVRNLTRRIVLPGGKK